MCFPLKGSSWWAINMGLTNLLYPERNSKTYQLEHSSKKLKEILWRNCGSNHLYLQILTYVLQNCSDIEISDQNFRKSDSTFLWFFYYMSYFLLLLTIPSFSAIKRLAFSIWSGKPLMTKVFSAGFAGGLLSSSQWAPVCWFICFIVSPPEPIFKC